MKAIVVQKYGGLENLQIKTVSKPAIKNPTDILVRIKAAAVNPVDTKLRQDNLGAGGSIEGEGRIFGFDGAGIVEEVGAQVKRFKVGDEVFFAGDLRKNGTYAQYTVVDERIVGKKPKSISFEEAATFPLTTLTAYEGLVDGLGLKEANVAEIYSTHPKKSILVIAGAGGVGSIVIQLAKKVFGLTVIATATRPQSQEFCKKMGADHVISHSEDLSEQLKKIGIPEVNYVFNCASTDDYIHKLPPVMKASGKIVLIVESHKPVDFVHFFFKRVSIAWELMFTRPIFNDEPEQQGRILDIASGLIDAGVLSHEDRISQKFKMEQIAEAHKAQESGSVVGKNVILID